MVKSWGAVPCNEVPLGDQSFGVYGCTHMLSVEAILDILAIRCTRLDPCSSRRVSHEFSNMMLSLASNPSSAYRPAVLHFKQNGKCSRGQVHETVSLHAVSNVVGEGMEPHTFPFDHGWIPHDGSRTHLSKSQANRKFRFIAPWCEGDIRRVVISEPDVASIWRLDKTDPR